MGSANAVPVSPSHYTTLNLKKKLRNYDKKRNRTRLLLQLSTSRGDGAGMGVARIIGLNHPHDWHP